MDLLIENLLGEAQTFAHEGFWLYEIVELLNLNGAASEFERVLLRGNGLFVLEVGVTFRLGLLAPH